MTARTTGTTAPWRRLTALLVLGAALALVACGSSGPQSWLDDNLTKVSGSDPEQGIVYSTNRPPPAAAQQVSSGTSPDDSIASGGSTFLRYGDEQMVVVAPAAQGSRAELWDFDAGYARYRAQVAAWDEFRGGGSGEGK